MAERLIDAEALKHKRIIAIYGNLEQGLEEREVVYVEDIDNAPVIEAKPIVYTHWISASWEEDEENGIENTYSDEFICSNCKEHLYFPDAIEKEDIGFSFCPYCGAQINEKENDND